MPNRTRTTTLLATAVAVVLLAAALAAPLARADDAAGTPKVAAPPFDRAMAEHLLNRAGFGCTPAQAEALAKLGREAAVRSLFDGAAAAALPAFESTIEGRWLTRRELAMLSEEERKARRQELRMNARQEIQAFRGWWVDRLVATPAPIEEKMVLFWHGHFTSSIRDVKDPELMIRQNELFRRHALGSFRSLLHEVARDPAMLLYLDNNRNKKGNPNENFARELMELFTLGVGHDTEADSKEAARAFPGWTLREGEFVFQRRQHDAGTKTILGRSGAFEGDDVLDILLEQETAPRFLASRLVAYFVGTTVPDGLVERVAAALEKHGWELRPALEVLFGDPAFYAPEVVGGRIAGPVELLVGICRRLGDAPPGITLARAAVSLGQSLLDPPNVKGWEGGDAWITTATFLQRGNIAGYLVEGIDPRRIREDFAGAGGRPADPKAAKGALRGMGVQGRGGRWEPSVRIADIVAAAALPGGAPPTREAVVDRLCDHFLAVPVTDEARESLTAFLGDEDGVEKDEARLKRLVHLILSLPEAQLN